MPTETTDCLPPPGTLDLTMHMLSQEAADGSRHEIHAIWTGGMWRIAGTQLLSPRKAYWADFRYERSINA
jgi:hypothetical protein